MGGTVGALALADFRERRRRPAYLVVLLGTLALGLLAAPVGDSDFQIFQISDYRGLYTSGYVGTVTALGGAVWLALAGFSITRGTIPKDERTGVGQILAATPMSRVSYLFGKFCSNLLVLGSMLLALALTAVGMQLLKGESYAVDPVRLLMPFVLITLPLLALVAACAVLLDTVPGLRGGIGALVWFVVWMVGMMTAQSSGGYDLLGMDRISDSMRTAIAAGGGSVDSVHFGVGLTATDGKLSTFDWAGLGPGDAGGSLLLNTVLLTAASVLIATVAVLWFRRFDPAAPVNRAEALVAGAAGALTQDTAASGPAGQVEQEGRRSASFDLDPAHMTPVRFGTSFPGTFSGELRVLLKGVRPWWWAGTAVLLVTAALVDVESLVVPVLALAVLWPVLIWSQLGHRADAGNVDDLLAACPGARQRLLAGLLAGITFGLLTASVPILRLAFSGDGTAVAAGLGGVLFVPALALACGVLSRGARLFQAVYPLLWYAMFNGVPELDFLGSAPGEGPAAAVVVGAALFLALVGLAADELRRARR
ncbi:ABC transporter permease [Kitasatospora albolonga]